MEMHSEVKEQELRVVEDFNWYNVEGDAFSQVVNLRTNFQKIFHFNPPVVALQQTACGRPRQAESL